MNNNMYNIYIMKNIIDVSIPGKFRKKIKPFATKIVVATAKSAV